MFDSYSKNEVKTSWAISSAIIIDEAKKMGLTAKIISEEDNFFTVVINGNDIHFKSVDCGLNSSFGYKIAKNKKLTYALAELHNIRVPKSTYISKSDFEEGMLNNYTDLVYPLITKPLDGAHGDGVAINLKNTNELHEGLMYTFSKQNVQVAIIQEQIFGTDHRIIVLDGSVKAAAVRIPPYIIGDGIQSILELIEEENKNPLRGTGKDHDSQMSRIKIDSESIKYLHQQGYEMSSILEQGKRINVRKNENLSTGGIAIDVTDMLHQEVKEEVIKMAKISGLGFCGVDFFCKDITLPLQEGGGAVIEINATPSIRMHHFPSEGKSRNIAKDILLALIKKNQEA